MNRRAPVIAAVSLAWSVLAAQPAKAQVVEVATGIAGDLVDGVLLSGKLVADLMPSLPIDDSAQLPPHARMYAEGQPACRILRVRAWDGYGWSYHRIQVCG